MLECTILPQRVNLVDFAMSALPIRYPRCQTFSHPIRTGLFVAFALELQIIRVPRWLLMMATIGSGARAISKEPAYRLHETGTQSALVSTFPILPGRNL
jgi:hypothetical protein